MASKIATLNLKWKAFRKIFNFVPTDAELARGEFGLGQDNGAQTFSKMLSGDQGVPTEILEVMAERVNRRIETVRAAASIHEPLGEQSITPRDLEESSLFEFIQKLVSVSPTSNGDRLDQLHRELIDALVPQQTSMSEDIRLKIERSSVERSFAPFISDDGENAPTVFEPGRHLGQFSIEDKAFGSGDAAPFAYVFLRRDTAPIGIRVWEQRFSDTFLWLASPFPLKVIDGTAQLFPKPVAVLPQPGRYRAVAVVLRDMQSLRRIDPRLDPRKAVEEMPPPVRLDEGASIRFLTNVGRAIERRDPTVAVTMADYIVTAPANEEAR
jgi:hypothetical protein